MPTSVHIPKPLLAAADRRARALKISRNHLIVTALERELDQGLGWSPGFFDELSEVDSDAARTLDETMKVVRAARRSKAPRRL